MVFILIWHIIVHGYNFQAVGFEGFTYRANVPLSLFLASLTLPATYCFIFISGYFGIKFRIKRLAELVLWCIFVSVGVTLIKSFLLHDEISLRELWEAFFPITANKWWFMTAYIQLFVLSPFLNYGMEKLCKRQQLTVLLLIYLFSIARMFMGGANAGSSLMGVVFVYLLGRYFKQYGIWSYKKSKLFYLFSLIAFFAITMSVYYISCITGKYFVLKLIFYFMGYANPLIIVMAISIFFIVLHQRSWENKVVNKLLSANLFIYLITESFGGAIIYMKLIEKFNESYFYGFCTFFLLLIGCLLIGFVIQNVINRIICVLCHTKEKSL